VACALTLGSAEVAFADPRADKLFEDANALMFSDPPKYQEAIEKYHQAIVLSPEGRFYFNLCVAYYSIGEFGLALQSCDAVATAGADAKLQEKTAKILKQVEDQIRAMGKDPEDLRRANNGGGGGDGGGGDGGGGDGGGGDGGGGDGGGGDGGGGDGGGGGGGAGGGGGGGEPVDTNEFKGAPPPSLFTAKPPSHDYTWSVGGELYGMSGKFGATEAYASGGAGFRVHADYVIVPARRIGLQGYLGFNQVGEGVLNDTLSIVDFGLAAYMHAYCTGRICVTPLVGAHIGGMQPESTGTEVRFAALGVRLEGAVSYSLGMKYEHVLALTPGLQFYLPSVGDYDGMDPVDFGLDKGSSAFYLGLGYTYRFDTPFGQAPFITLE
jgi:tetratricopeptide (TPR) repeat protein